jgi:mono/diheme cytochrome c family protein
MRRALSIAMLVIAIFASIALPANAALQGDSARGKKLHDANCVRCHDTSVYTRKDRQIKSPDALREQLSACSHGAQVALTDDEQKSIVKYLSDQFYNFN